MPLRFHPTGRYATRVAALAVLVLAGCATPFPGGRRDVVSNLHDADYSKQAFELSMAALKGFRGDIHYVGSDDRFDYFRVERERGFFRMARRGSSLAGHRRFEVGSEAPIRMGRDVIPYPPRRTTRAEQVPPSCDGRPTDQAVVWKNSAWVGRNHFRELS